tara:strand:+ start:1203 stop:1433 length:231 start_codon:yes stop_codon:yes gene_type:complete
MDSDIQRIKELIESKKDKYPNISNIWLEYLNEKINLLYKSLEKAEDIFTNIENISNQDLPYSTIAILYLLNQQSLP